MSEQWEVAYEKLGGRISSLERRVDDHQEYIEEVSRPFHQRLDNFMTDFKAVERERDKVSRERHQSNTTKLNILIVVASFGSLIIAAIGVLISIQLARHAQVVPPDLFHSDQQYLSSTDNAGGAGNIHF